MRIPVHKQRDVLTRINQHPDESSRSIARAIGVAANSVKVLRQAYQQAGLSIEVLQELDDVQWSKKLDTADRSIAQRKPAPDWEYVHEQMGRADSTLNQLWIEFRRVQPGGIGITQFFEGYRAYTRQLNISMRRLHAPGAKMHADFCGRTVPIRDANGGPGFDAQIFIGVLGYSNFVFAHAVASQKIEDWIACHVACFEYFGGSPEWCVSDNLKAAVNKRTRDELFINRSYRECLGHYGVTAAPRRARKPRDNAKAEAAVQFVQRAILYGLRDMVFFSLGELNAELRRRLTVLNDRPFKKLPGSRRSRFEEVERAELKPLPDLPFESRDWRHAVLVGEDYVFDHEKSFYSVPYELRRTRVDLRITAKSIEAFQSGRRIAIHERSFVRGSVSIQDAHRPVSHLRVLEGEPKHLLSWASSAGANTLAMFEHHLMKRADLTNGLSAARRLRELARQHGEERFEEACAYALPLNMTSLKNVTSILSTSPDKRRRDRNSPPKSLHSNVRGATYFGDDA